MAKKPPSRREGWFPVAEAAAAVRVTRQTFHEIWRPKLAAAEVKKHGKETLVYLPAVVELRCQAREDKGRKEALEQAGDDAALLAGGQSPALEEYRRHAAREKKVKADLLEKRSVPLDELRPQLMMLAQALRNACDTLVRKHGNDVAEILGETMDEVEAAWQKLVIIDGAELADAEAPDGTGGDDPPAETQDHAAVRGGGDHPADWTARGAKVPG